MFMNICTMLIPLLGCHRAMRYLTNLPAKYFASQNITCVENINKAFRKVNKIRVVFKVRDRFVLLIPFTYSNSLSNLSSPPHADSSNFYNNLDSK